jgi:hypothetical protein
MNELDVAQQKRLVISSYWPQKNDDELHVGYGVARDYLVYESAGIIFMLTNRIFRMIFEPKIRALNPWLRSGPATLITLALALLMKGKRKVSGFYQLDEHGTPTFFIGKFPPENIKGRVGISRKKFLQSLSQ